MELGDKTQLVIILLSTRKFHTKLLAIGAVTGFLVIVTIGGLIASVLTKFIPISLISLFSGIGFLILGLCQLILIIVNYVKKKEEQEEFTLKSNALFTKSQNSFLVGFLAIISMEIGDKTQIATIMLASSSPSYFGSLLGAWLALSILAIIGAFAGSWIATKVPKKIMDVVASILFIIVGIIIIITNLPL